LEELNPLERVKLLRLLFSVDIDDGSFRNVVRKPSRFWPNYGLYEIHEEIQIEIIPFRSYPGFMGRPVFEETLNCSLGNIIAEKREEKPNYECKYQRKLI